MGQIQSDKNCGREASAGVVKKGCKYGKFHNFHDWTEIDEGVWSHYCYNCLRQEIFYDNTYRPY